LKITREFKTGLVAVLVIALFIWGFNYMKGLNLFDGPQKTYFTEYSNVQGLNTASVVTINGVEVGKVVDIAFNKNPEKRGKLIVEFSVEKDFDFSVNSVAKIYSASLMGGKSLAIVPSYEGETAKPGDYLKGEIESDIFTSVSEKINPLQAKVENVIVSADSLMVGLNEVLNYESRNNLKQTIKDLSITVTSFKNSAQSVNNMLKTNENSIETTLDNIAKTSANFEKISDSLANVNLAQTVRELEGTISNLKSVLATIESGEGTLGKLLNDDEMYVNLTNASKELEELLRELKLHPKRFVHFSLFGKKDKGYKPEEDSKE
jgi:phospholipid/cholesterol/gamma-HCH transport system substrate-binding protein